MKMDVVAGSKFDEFYTPNYAVMPILKYLKPHSTIWCPFDKTESNFVKIFESEGHEVIHSHIDDGLNFLYKAVCPDNIDYIISNPPYSKKNEVFNKLFDLKTPFAMLVGVVGIFESELRFNLFKNNDFEIMYFDKRISYFKNYCDQKPSVNPPFSSVYICNNILPKQIVFEEIDKKSYKNNLQIGKKEEIQQIEYNELLCSVCGFNAKNNDEFESHKQRPFHLNSLGITV